MQTRLIRGICGERPRNFILLSRDARSSFYGRKARICTQKQRRRKSRNPQLLPRLGRISGQVNFLPRSRLVIIRKLQLDRSAAGECATFSSAPLDRTREQHRHRPEAFLSTNPSPKSFSLCSNDLPPPAGGGGIKWLLFPISPRDPQHIAHAGIVGGARHYEEMIRQTVGIAQRLRIDLFLRR